MEVSMTVQWPLEWFIPNPNEQVALLIGEWRGPKKNEEVFTTSYSPWYPGARCTVGGVYEVMNAAANPRNHYAILRSDLEEASEYGLVIGVAHTHNKQHQRSPTQGDLYGLMDDMIGAVVFPWPGGPHTQWFGKE